MLLSVLMDSLSSRLIEAAFLFSSFVCFSFLDLKHFFVNISNVFAKLLYFVCFTISICFHQKTTLDSLLVLSMLAGSVEIVVHQPSDGVYFRKKSLQISIAFCHTRCVWIFCLYFDLLITISEAVLVVVVVDISIVHFNLCHTSHIKWLIIVHLLMGTLHMCHGIFDL